MWSVLTSISMHICKYIKRKWLQDLNMPMTISQLSSSTAPTTTTTTTSTTSTTSNADAIIHFPDSNGS